MALATITIDADESFGPDVDTIAVDGPNMVLVEFGDDSGVRQCLHCGADIAEYETWQHENGREECDPKLVMLTDDSYDPERGMRKAEPVDRGVSEFVNSAGIHFDSDSVRVTISVGDPRGAFAMTVTRGPDGQLRLTVPYESMGLAHMQLKQLHPGTFDIG